MRGIIVTIWRDLYSFMHLTEQGTYAAAGDDQAITWGQGEGKGEIGQGQYQSLLMLLLYYYLLLLNILYCIIINYYWTFCFTRATVKCYIKKKVTD